VLHLSNKASVIFTSSGVGKIGKAFWGAYSVSKFGIEGLSQILSNEHSNDKSIRFNCINPGAIDTKMRKAAYPLENPMNLLKPQDIMEKYLWLMSDDSSDVFGQSIDCQ
jgi:NAD(P)-dependent dehydrogenase (short-subunit alcohol dehydrogenase family)